MGEHRAQLGTCSETELLHPLQGKERILKMCIRILSFDSAFTVWLVPKNSNALGRLGLRPWAPGQRRRTGMVGRGAPAAAAAHRGCARACGWVTVSQASLPTGRQNQEPFAG